MSRRIKPDLIEVECTVRRRVERLRLRKGDVIVVTFPNGISPKESEIWKSLLADDFPGHEIVILGEDAQIEIERRT